MAPTHSWQVVVPESYSSLDLQDIRVSNHPPTAPGVTPVQIVTLNRPQQRNAFTLRMMQDLELVYPTFDVDERVKCIVLTGAGSSFCAGADLQLGFNALGRKSSTCENRDTSVRPSTSTSHILPLQTLTKGRSGGRVNLAIFRCRKPSIVALNGSAAGVGMTMTLAAAIRIAHTSSKYVFPFVQRGITMESNSSFFLPRLIGYSDALYLLTTGEPQRGDSKFLSSLFHEIYDDGVKVLSRALDIATSVAEKTSGLASFLSRELMWRGPPTPEEAHILESAVGFHVAGSADVKEGVSSFFEKRSPRFSATLEKDGPPIYPWWREVDVGVTRPSKTDPKAKL